MSHRFAIGLCLLALAFAGATGARAANYYAFFDLGAAGDAGGSAAYGINSSNEVVGRYFPASGSDAAIWSLSGGNYTRTAIPSLDGSGDEGIGNAINDYGTVAGQSSAPSGTYNQAFLWTPAIANGTTGTMTDVAAKMPGITAASRLMAINGAGQAVGYGNGGSGAGACYWDGTSATTTLIPLPAGASSAFTLGAGINNAGLVAGTEYPSSGYQAIIWRPGDASTTNINGPINAALVPAGTCASVAVAVNNDNQVVGYYTKGTLTDYGYLYNNSGNVVDLGNLGYAGGGSLSGTSAMAINDQGCVVGSSLTSGSTGAQHAFLWTPAANNGTTGSMIDLNSQLVNSAAVPSGYYLDAATGINNAGSICGYMYNGTAYRAFALLATLPGDANLDGRVDVNDLTIVLSHFGQTGAAWAQGEFTGDGKVDVNDLTIVLANFGQSGGSSAEGMAAVPEPASMAMLAALLLAAAWTANFWKRFHT